MQQIDQSYRGRRLVAIEPCAANPTLCHGLGGFAVTIEYAHADGEVEVLRYDRVIRATVRAPDETVLLLPPPPLPVVGVSIWMERGCQ